MEGLGSQIYDFVPASKKVRLAREGSNEAQVKHPKSGDSDVLGGPVACRRPLRCILLRLHDHLTRCNDALEYVSMSNPSSPVCGLMMSAAEMNHH